MRKSCSADVCKTNYGSEKKKRKKSNLNVQRIRVFSFPKDPNRSTAWVSALPNVLQKVTNNMGVCEKHWPLNFPTIRVKGHDLPLNPPSIWSVPDSFCRQHKSRDRLVKNRGIDAESRGSIADTSGEVKIDPNRIQSWEPLVDFCQQLGLPLTVKEESIALYNCNNEVPPRIEFSITINRDFSLSCHGSATYMPTRELVDGFSGKLELFSQVTHVIDKVKTFKLDIASELISCKNEILK